MKLKGNSNHCTNPKHQNRKNHNRQKRHWNIRISTWLAAFLVSFLLAACGSTEGGFSDSTGVVNGVTESRNADDTGTATNPPSENDYASGKESTSEDKPDEDGLEASEDKLDEDGLEAPEDKLDEDGLEAPENKPDENDLEAETLAEDGAYTSKEDVAYYLYLYGHLPSNFITKKEAEKLGWKGGSLEPFAPGKCIGGNRFGNYEGLLPAEEGRFYTECDIDTLGADKRGAKRIVFSNDGLIYYTEDHYKSFELLYGEE